MSEGPLYDRADLSDIERDHAEGTLSEERVIRLQRRLAEAGHYLGDLDGLYGTQTRNALRDYIADAEGDAMSEVRANVPVPSQEEVRRMGATLQNKMAACWSVDPGANTPAVTMAIQLDLEGQLRGPPVVVERERLSDRWFRSAAYNACEAVVRCAPFSGLPPEHYNIWKNLRLRFDPSER